MEKTIKCQVRKIGITWAKKSKSVLRRPPLETPSQWESQNGRQISSTHPDSRYCRPDQCSSDQHRWPGRPARPPATNPSCRKSFSDGTRHSRQSSSYNPWTQLPNVEHKFGRTSETTKRFGILPRWEICTVEPQYNEWITRHLILIRHNIRVERYEGEENETFKFVRYIEITTEKSLYWGSQLNRINTVGCEYQFNRINTVGCESIWKFQ